MVNNGNLPNNVEMERTGVYKISFVPIAAGTQTVDINFNKESIPSKCEYRSMLLLVGCEVDLVWARSKESLPG